MTLPTPTAVLLVALTTTLACARSEAPGGCGSLRWGERAQGASVILVVADTLRRDAPGAYGGPARTPAFDAVARRGILFERAYSQASWTKPAVATLFTGLHPSQHRVTTHPAERGDGARGPLSRRHTDALSSGFSTLAEAYQEAGFVTAAFVSNPWLEKSFGFAQGFDSYDDSFARWEAPGSLVSLAAIRWLEDLDPQARFFLYLHYLDPHRPYGPLDRRETLARADELKRDERPLPTEARAVLEQDARFVDGSSALEAGLPPTLALLERTYAAGVERFDAALGEFLVALEAHRDMARTALLVTSDHGESLYAHGFGNHGTSLYEDEVAIPLVMRLPGIEARGARNDCPIGLVDLMSLLCAYSGLDCPAHQAGSAAVLAGAPAAAPYVVTEGVRGAPRHRALVGPRYKLLFEPDHPARGGRSPYRFFDLETDPGEHRDLVQEAPNGHPDSAAFDAMRAALPEAVPAYRAPAAERLPIDPELEERLDALGYVE